MKLIEDYLKKNMGRKDIPFCAQLDERRTSGLKKWFGLMDDMIEDDGQISIFPDYDVDGVISGVILIKGLLLLGVDGKRINLVYPDRSIGYGLSETYLEKMKGSKYIMTTDNGCDAFEMLKQTGYLNDHVFLLSDHHTQVIDIRSESSEYENFALVDPNSIGDETEFKPISGSTVIYKILYSYAVKKGVVQDGELSQFDRLKELAGLTVISDIMPLVGENVTLLKSSLKAMNKDSREPIWDVLAEALLNDRNGKFGYDDIGWKLSPTLNSDSRVNLVPRTAFELLLTNDPERMTQLAKQLVKTNLKRKETTQNFIERDDYNVSCLNVIDPKGDPDHTRPYLGLVASKLVERFGRPSLVVTQDGETLSGSARSFGDFNLVDQFSQDDELKSLGFALHGHPGAAGVELPVKNIDQVMHRLDEIWDAYADGKESLEKNDINLSELYDGRSVSIDQIKTLEGLGPFGLGHEKPRFVIKQIDLSQGSLIGKNGQTFRMYSPDSDILIWNYPSRFSEKVDLFDDSKKYDLIGSYHINKWRGEERLNLIVDEII